MNIIENADMSRYCTYKAGGSARYLISVENIEELREALKMAKEKKLDSFILGRGSNVLVRDGGYDGIIIRLSGEFTLIESTQNVITAGAAATNVEVSVLARDEGLSGIEFMHGIPGSIGGAVFMNAGAYGSEICDYVDEVTFMDEDYNVVAKPSKDIDFGYRHTEFMDGGGIIISVKLRIEDAGLKGASIGGAEVSTKHSGFIINKGEATANDITDLIKLVQKRVKKNSGIDLKTEVRIIGKDR